MPSSNITKQGTVVDGANSQVANFLDAPGDRIDYTVTVAIGLSPGEASDTYSLSITIDDDVAALTYSSGDTNTNGLLDTGEIWTFTGSYITTQNDYDSNGTFENSDNVGFSDLPGQINNAVNVTYMGIYDPLGPGAGPGQITNFTLNGSETAATIILIDPDIDIEKATNGEDADSPTGPYIVVGDPVNWTYVVTNTGNVTITNVVVVDDNGTPGTGDDLSYNDGSPDELVRGADIVGNDDDVLDVGEVWSFSAAGTATAGQYANNAEVTGLYTGTDPATQVNDEDPSHYFGADPDIHIEKSTNGEDADNPTGPVIATGGAVTWSYVVTNPGNVPISNVVVVDDNGTPGVPGDDFNPTPVLSGGFNVGDTNMDGLLDPAETWQYTANGTAQAGQYANIGRVTGLYVATPVEDDDPSHYYGANPSLSIVKKTNGTDDECPDILVGGQVLWTYEVTNDGDVSLTNIDVEDDNGTPGNTGDDFNPTPDETGGFNDGDLNTNGLLDPGETWYYSAAGVATLGQYMNTATANGEHEVSDQISIPAPEASDDDCYEGVEPGIQIVKTTNGTDNQCPVVEVGSVVTWGYYVTNTGPLAIENVIVEDDNGTAGDTGDDFNPTPILSGGFNVGDLNMDDILDPGETWEYSETGIAVEGPYTNWATVDGTAIDAFGNFTSVSDRESDCYDTLQDCIGVGTPGFWANNGAVFWDNTPGNEAKAGMPGFPLGELIYAVDSNDDTNIDGLDEPGLLIGDFNRDGLSAGEDVIFISLADAKALVSGGGGNNGVDKLGRDLVATWMNFLTNGEGCIDDLGTTADDGFNPKHFIEDAVNWLQEYASDVNDHTLDFAVFDASANVKVNKPAWKNDFLDNHSASEMHSALDGYNNSGWINGVEFCCDRDSVGDQSGLFVIA